MSSLLIVFMFLFFTVPSIIFKLYFIALAFTIYGCAFGFEEFLANHYTGKTVSQHIWALIVAKQLRGYKILAFMLIGWLCFIVHFFFKGLVSDILFASFFLWLAIPSFIYKEYFLTLASMLFVLAIGFTDAIALKHIGMDIGTQLHSFILIHPFKGITILLSLLAGWLCLLAHLGIKFKKG